MNTVSVVDEFVQAPILRSDPQDWVETHADALFRYALVRLRSRELAEDMVQETFLAALKARAGFAGQSSERTWLIGILKHKIIDHFRRSSREVTGLQDVELPVTDEQDSFRAAGEWIGHWKPEAAPSEWNTTPEALMEQKDFWGIFEECLSELPERMARAFVLRELEGMSTEEICSLLNISTSNFWVMIHRARMQLRRGLETRHFNRSGQKVRN